MKSKLSKYLLATTAMAVLIAFVAPQIAAAQEAPAAASEVKKSSGDEIVIVGSRIRRDNFTTAQPVQVVTRDETTMAGFSSATDVLQGTGVSAGSSQINNAYGGFVTDGGQGANTFGLRGLGATRTLVLLNGRRLAPAGTRGAVGSADLNVLPDAMVDHIEVLKDGASSIYGSDAVAGVVNIVTRKAVQGWELEGQYNHPVQNGGDKTRLSVVTGYTNDRLKLSGSLEYYKRNGLTLGDRDWSNCQVSGLYDPNTGAPASYIDPATGAPKCFPTGLTGENGVTINTIGTATTAGVAALGSTGTSFNRWRPNANVTTGLVGYEGIGGPLSLDVRTTYDPKMLNSSVISGADIYTGFLQGQFDFHALGNAQGYFEVLANERKSSQVGYRQLAADYPNGSPLLPAIFAGKSAAQAESPHPSVNGIRAFIGFGNDTSSQKVDYYKSVAGLRGDFFLPNWHYDTSLSYARSDGSYTQQSFIWDKLTASLNVVPNGSGGFKCANAAFVGCVAAPTLTPAVVGGDLPQAWRDYIFQPVTGETIFTEWTGAAALDGPLFTLPAGEVKGAFGVEVRRSEIDDEPSIDSINSNLYNLTSSVVTKGTDTVREAYGEVEVPILADLPLAKELTLNLAGRYTDYDSYGAQSTYKGSARYEPTNWLAFRGSYGTSFRAPALFEQFLGATTGFLAAAADPCTNYGSLPTSSNRFINCDSELHDTNFTQPTTGVTVYSGGGAVTGLSAETSVNYGFGFILNPKLPEALGDLSFAADFYRIKVENEVERVGAGNIMQLCYDDPQFRAGGGFCNLIGSRDASSKALQVFDNYTNIATQIVRGIDYNIRYRVDIGPGQLGVNSTVTQYLQQANKLFQTDALEEDNGILRHPKWTSTTDVTYDVGQMRFRYGLTYLGKMDSNEFEGVDVTSDPYNFATPTYLLHNVSAQYTSPDDDWKITGGVRNLFDKTPPYISAGAYDRIGNTLLYSGFDYVGREVFVDVTKKF